MASELNSPRYGRLEHDKNANTVPDRHRAPLSITTPPFHRSCSDQELQGTLLEAHPKYDSYRPRNHSYISASDSYRPGNNRKLSSDIYRPSGHIERTTHGDTQPSFSRSLSTSHNVDLHEAQSKTFPQSLTQRQTDGIARGSDFAANIDTANPLQSSTHPAESPFDFSKVPRGPALMTFKGPTLKGLVRNPRATRDWKPLGVDIEEGSEPSEAAKRSPYIFVTLYDMIHDRSVSWTISLLENFHNYLTSPKVRVGLITKYFVSPRRVFVFAELQVLEKVDAACKKELLFSQYQMESSRPKECPTEADLQNGNLSYSLGREKMQDGAQAPMPTARAFEERDSQRTSHDSSFPLPGLLSGVTLRQYPSTTPPYLPTHTLSERETQPLTVRDVPNTVSVVDITHADFRSNHDMCSSSSPHPDSEISSIRSINSMREHQCAQCKNAATGIDPVVRCSRCKRKYHDSCRNLMKGSSVKG
jgi:hypothetical protein